VQASVVIHFMIGFDSRAGRAFWLRKPCLLVESQYKKNAVNGKRSVLSCVLQRNIQIARVE